MEMNADCDDKSATSHTPGRESVLWLKLKLSLHTIDSSNIDNSSSNSCESLWDSKSDADFESAVDRHPGQQVGSAGQGEYKIATRS